MRVARLADPLIKGTPFKGTVPRSLEEFNGVSQTVEFKRVHGGTGRHRTDNRLRINAEAYELLAGYFLQGVCSRSRGQGSPPVILGPGVEAGERPRVAGDR